MIPSRFQRLSSGKLNKAVLQASLAFIDEIWTYPPSSFTFIGIKHGNAWIEHAIKGERLDQVAKILADFPPHKADVYFCPNAFERSNRKAELTLPTRYAWCDIDDADPHGYSPEPNILWETSPGRHQGIWIWNAEVPGHVAAQHSKCIVYRYGGDRSGWSSTKMLRVPGTVNHKAEYTKPVVRLKTYSAKAQQLPKSIATFKAVAPQIPLGASEVRVSKVDAQEVMSRYEKRLPLFPRSLMMANRVIYPDRSAAIFVIVSALLQVGAVEAELVGVLLANPHFLNKHGHNQTVAEREVACIRAKLEAER